MSHNGWTNYPTWLVVSTFDNVESLYNFSKDAVKEVKEKFSEDERISQLAHLLKNTVESMAPHTNNMIWGPLINNELQTINFPEIARNMLEEM